MHSKDENESAEAFCQRTLDGIKKKADHNKSESLWCLRAIVVSALASSLFVTLGDGRFWGKIVPSVLSLIAAAGTAWLQQRRPQQLWGLYRTAQRELEDQQTKYKFRLLEYADAEHPEKLLAERVAAVALRLHQQWVSLIPTPETLKVIEANKP
jgi:hypothetical protein